MPVENGFDLLKWLKNRRFGTPAIMITARACQETKEKSLQLGAAHFISKPIMFEQLIECISRTLEKKK